MFCFFVLIILKAIQKYIKNILIFKQQSMTAISKETHELFEFEEQNKNIH
jgi:hypothetical protein